MLISGQQRKVLRDWLVLGDGSVWVSTGWYMVVLCQYRVVLVDLWWYWVRKRQYWLILGGTESVWDGAGWYLVVVCQYKLVRLGITWYWVRIGLLCLYKLKKNGDLVGCYHSVTTNDRTRKDRATQPWTMEGWDEQLGNQSITIQNSYWDTSEENTQWEMLEHKSILK